MRARVYFSVRDRGLHEEAVPEVVPEFPPRGAVADFLDGYVGGS